MKRSFPIIFLLALIALAGTGQSAAAPEHQRCFTETSHCIKGTILDSWERNGGLPAFGYPIGGKKIYRIWNSIYAPGRLLVAQVHDDTWTTSDPIDYGLAPPAGHYAPLRGFDLLWISNKFVRQDLGWPTAPEQAARAVVQQFGGGTALWLMGSDKVYVLGPQSAAHVIAYR